MEDIRKIRTIITRINMKCDKESISLSDALNKLGITILNYLEIIGMDVKILNENTLKEIENLFSLKDTKVIASPNMKDIDTDEIEIFSKSYPCSIHYQKNKITLNGYNKKENEENIYEDSIVTISKKDEEISFNLSTITDKSVLKNRILTEKYLLKHMRLIVTYKQNKQKSSYEFIINNDMLKSDLNYLLRLLMNFKFVESYAILKKYPASIKIISDNEETCIK